MDYCEVPLRGARGAGKFVLVDEDDFPWVSQNLWRLDTYGYVIGPSGRTSVFLHRLVAGSPEGLEVDHINQNKLDCRKANLRHATRAQNARNQRLTSANNSGFKGVRLHKGMGRWEARIKVNGRDRYLGLHNNPRDAARAYDVAAAEAFGEFAVANASMGLLSDSAGRN